MQSEAIFLFFLHSYSLFFLFRCFAKVHYMDSRTLSELFLFVDGCLIVDFCGGTEAEVSYVGIITLGTSFLLGLWFSF